MSWGSIAAALKTRLAAVSGVGKTHSFQRVFKGSSDQTEFQSAYCKDRLINVWMVTRTKRVSSPIPGESKRRVRHSVLILGLLKQDDARTSDATFEGVVDGVCVDLETGDRTLGGACVTHGQPEAAISLGKLSEQDVHLAQIAFDVEEVL